MPNVYRETAQPAAPTPPLQGDMQADAVVVGGGFTGLSTALHLAELGTRAVLLDAEEPGWGASGRNGGQVNPGLKHDPDVVERDYGAELGGRMNVLTGGAPAFVFDLIARHGIRCEARRNGTLRAALGPKSAVQLRLLTEQWARRGAPVELLEGAAIESATGTNRYAAVMLDRRGGDLNPLSFARGLGAAAMASGAVIHGGTRVIGIDRAGSAWRVRAAAGNVTAAHVVLATNGYTDDLWPRLRRTIVPVFGAVVATAPLRDDIAQQVMPSRGVLYETGAVTVYYRVDSSRRLLIGGRGPMREIAAPGEVPHLLTYARELWPSLRAVQWTHAWGGRLAMTQDQYPHIHEPAPGIITCLGYNGRGLAVGTAMGKQIAQRIVDRCAPFDMPISALKPIALHGLWPLAVRAVITRGRLAGLFRF